MIPRNHQVEEALAVAEERAVDVMERLVGVLAASYDYERARAVPEYCAPAPEGGEGYQTFCGT